jgi:hypothetical protein
MALAYLGGVLGLCGLALTGLGLFAPEATHDAMHWLEHLFAAGAAHH